MRIVLPNKTIERTPTFAGLCGTAHGHRWASDGDAKGCMVTPADEMLAGSEPLSDRPFGLAVFDLDGTLLRGPTVCEVLARALGRLDHMRQLEALIAGLRDIDIAAAREEMVRWYREVSPADLTSRLGMVTLAPELPRGSPDFGATAWQWRLPRSRGSSRWHGSRGSFTLIIMWEPGWSQTARSGTSGRATRSHGSKGSGILSGFPRVALTGLVTPGVMSRCSAL
jgi:hypothetical protein